MNKILLLILLTGWFDSTYAQFKEVAAVSGVNHVHVTQTLMGGGAVFFDYNNDGFIDLYATNPTGHDQLYQNFGDGTFFDVSFKSNISSITKSYYSFGAIAGDINNDGCDDVFVSTFNRDEHNLLLLNNCDGTFTDISVMSGITDETSSSGAVFIDFNQDGLLDIYVINYIDEFIFIKDENDIIVDIDRYCLPNLLYINQGNNLFSEAASDYSIDNDGCGLAVLATDFDFDGDQDIYIANDHGMHVVPNTLYNNDFPEDSFTDLSIEAGLNASMFGMGIACGDFNGNGLNDYYLSNLGNNVFLTNTSTVYENVASDLAVENGYYDDSVSVTSWGTFFFDYDNDTDLDLFISNGYIRTGYFGFKTAAYDKNVLFNNSGNGSFNDVSVAYDMNDSLIGRGAAYADYDRDGDLDFFVVSSNKHDGDRSLLYENKFTGNHWVEFDLLGSENSTKNAFGALISVHVDGKKFTRELSSGGSFASQHSQIIQFGLGKYTEIDSLEVKWPSHRLQKFYNISTDNIYFLEEGSNNLEIEGCMDENANNYASQAAYNTACIYDKVKGCTVLNADNYDQEANFDDGTCTYSLVNALQDNKVDIRVQMYPNPVKGYLHLTDESEVPCERNRIVLIYNAQGNVIYSYGMWKSGELILDMIGFPKGLLIVKVFDRATGKVLSLEKIIH